MGLGVGIVLVVGLFRPTIDGIAAVGRAVLDLSSAVIWALFALRLVTSDGRSALAHAGAGKRD